MARGSVPKLECHCQWQPLSPPPHSSWPWAATRGGPTRGGSIGDSPELRPGRRARRRSAAARVGLDSDGVNLDSYPPAERAVTVRPSESRRACGPASQFPTDDCASAVRVQAGAWGSRRPVARRRRRRARRAPSIPTSGQLRLSPASRSRAREGPQGGHGTATAIVRPP